MTTNEERNVELAKAIDRTFFVSGPMAINMNSIEAPFIIHWLETWGDRFMSDLRAGYGGNRSHTLAQARTLYGAACEVCGVWAGHTEDTKRIAAKLSDALAYKP